MDFSRFDQRGRDEAGVPFPILHPESGEPVVDPDSGLPCMVLVRGPTAPSVTKAEAARFRAGVLTAEDAAQKSLAEIHDYSVEVALPYIAGFENVNRGDRPATEADAAWFLSLNFPRIEKVGEEYRIANKTFAKQINDRIAEAREQLGNAPAP